MFTAQDYDNILKGNYGAVTGMDASKYNTNTNATTVTKTETETVTRTKTTTISYGSSSSQSPSTAMTPAQSAPIRIPPPNQTVHHHHYGNQSNRNPNGLTSIPRRIEPAQRHNNDYEHKYDEEQRHRGQGLPFDGFVTHEERQTIGYAQLGNGMVARINQVTPVLTRVGTGVAFGMQVNPMMSGIGGLPYGVQMIGTVASSGYNPPELSVFQPSLRQGSSNWR